MPARHLAEERRPQVLRALSSPTLRLSVDPEPLLDHSRDVFTRRQLARSTGLETDHVRTRLEREGHDCSAFLKEEHEEDHGESRRHDDDHDEDDEHEEDEYHRDANCPPVISASLALSSGVVPPAHSRRHRLALAEGHTDQCRDYRSAAGCHACAGYPPSAAAGERPAGSTPLAVVKGHA